MSYQAIKEYLIAILTRYQKADKKGKTRLLNEAIEVTQLSRKHLIRCLKLSKEKLQKKTSGRRPKYPPELLLPHIRYLWGQMERISGRRVKAAYPDTKLKEKIRIGARIVKKYDKPQTPYDRLMKSPHLSEERKEDLRKMKAKLNPFNLKKDLEAKLAIFFEQLRKSKIREVS